MILKRCLLIAAVAVSMQVRGQISPPGLDDTKVAFWSAIGVSQKLSDRFNLSVYIGQARQSDPDNFAFIKKQAIYVLNQETTLRVSNSFAMSFCASYRIQNRYDDETPYSPADPETRNEERYYLRFYYYEKIGNTKLTFSFRPELRLYSSAHHESWVPTDEELRFRLKGQAAVPLGNPDNQFILANEILSTTDHEKKDMQTHWTAFGFTEDRLSTYFRHTAGKVITDIGLMHQIGFDGDYILHLAVDVILTDPFGKK